MYKQIGSALLALAMAVVLVPAVADAAGGSGGGGGGGGSVKTLEIRVTGSPPSIIVPV